MKNLLGKGADVQKWDSKICQIDIRNKGLC